MNIITILLTLLVLIIAFIVSISGANGNKKGGLLVLLVGAIILFGPDLLCYTGILCRSLLFYVTSLLIILVIYTVIGLTYAYLNKSATTPSVEPEVIRINTA